MVLALVLAFTACGKETPETTTTEAETEATTEAPSESKEDASEAVTDESATDVSEEETETTAEAGKAPETTEEIVAYFNEAVNNVKSNSKSLLARDIWDTNEYYQLINTINDIYCEGVKQVGKKD